MPIKLAPLLQRRGNAAYAVGRFIEKSNDDATMTKTDPQILNRLDRLFSIMEGRGRNNAAGCISRLILKHRNNVPVAEVLPAHIAGGDFAMQYFRVGPRRQADRVKLSRPPSARGA